MSTATLAQPILATPVSVASLVPAGVELASLAPAGESPATRAAVARSLAAAVARSLSVFAVPAGVVPGAPAGSPVWCVPSASVAGRAHLVWVAESGRLACSCPAHLSPRVVCCSHAAAVRLVLLAGAGRLVGASVPASLPAPAPVAPPVAPDPEPEPEPPSPPSGGGVPGCAKPVCPECSLPAEQRELEELGECLSCVAASAGAELARCSCGAVASGEDRDGPLCDACQQQRAQRYAQLRSTVERGQEIARAESERRKKERTRPKTTATATTATAEIAEELGEANGYTYRSTTAGEVIRSRHDNPTHFYFFCTWAAWLSRGRSVAGMTAN